MATILLCMWKLSEQCLLNHATSLRKLECQKRLGYNPNNPVLSLEKFWTWITHLTLIWATPEIWSGTYVLKWELVPILYQRRRLPLKAATECSSLAFLPLLFSLLSWNLSVQNIWCYTTRPPNTNILRSQFGFPVNLIPGTIVLLNCSKPPQLLPTAPEDLLGICPALYLIKKCINSYRSTHSEQLPRWTATNRDCSSLRV